MSLTDLVQREAIVHRLRAPSKQALFAALAARAGKLSGIPPDVILDDMARREAEGTTGFGEGVAFPHARLEQIAHPWAVFARLEEAVDYEALDQRPVDLIFLLLSPPIGSAEHLKAFARASRTLRDPRLAAKLRGASSADSIYALLADAPEAIAA